MVQLRRRAFLGVLLAFVLAVSSLVLPVAAASTSFTTISSSGPLAEIMLGTELSCQVRHVQDSSYEFYPPATRPGDCGTFLVVDGVLYAPDFPGHGGTATGNIGNAARWTPVSQSSVSGAGTSPNPFRVVTVADAGASGVRITQTDSYVVGERFYTSDIQVSYTGAGSKSILLYRAGDCFLGNTDLGYGYYDPTTGTVGCSVNPNDSPPDRYIKWIPHTPGSRYYESFYGSVWSWIGGKTAFPDTCDCGTFQDNGAGLSWSASVPSGGSVTFTHDTAFGVPSNPVFVEPTPCATGTTVEGTVHVPLGFGVRASEEDAARVLTLAMTSAPAGLAFAPGAPGNPADGATSWPDPAIGVWHALFTATNDLGKIARCDVTIIVRAPDAQALSLAAWAGTSVPASIEAQTRGVDVRANGADVHRTAVADFPDAHLYAKGLEEAGRVIAGDDGVYATSTVQIAEVRLLDGLVIARGLEANATARFDPRNPSASQRAHSDAIATLLVGGTPVVLSGGPQDVPLPGGGTLRLFETVLDSQDGTGARYQENLLHVYLAPGTYGRSEIIVGTVAALAADHLGFIGQERFTLPQDDARSGGDAGDDFDHALPLANGVYDGATTRTDTVDIYAVHVAPGENVKVFVAPAARATSQGGGVTAAKTPGSPELPNPTAGGLLVYELALFDPTRAQRDVFRSSGTPLTVELNADIEGDWLVRLTATPPTDGESRNYTLALVVAPAPLLPELEKLPGDAPEACVPGDASIPTIGTGATAGVIGVDDHVDVYRFHADIGQLVAATLKPGEDANAVAMDLALFDASCSLLQRSSQRIDGGKGLPQEVTMLPTAASGDYYLAVERVNGIGNYALALAIVDPMPSAPGNDAGSGADAPADPQAMDAPPGAFQGRLADGDAGDAYRMPFVAGRQAVVSFDMSALSAANVRLRAPSGALVPSTNVGGLAVWSFKAAETGDYTLVVSPAVGGGNYLVAWGQAPA